MPTAEPPLGLSIDDVDSVADSIADSEQATSSVIRLPQLFPAENVTSAFSTTPLPDAANRLPSASTPTMAAYPGPSTLTATPQSLPPPLPPKPLFARSTSLQRLVLPLPSRTDNTFQSPFLSPANSPPPLPPKPERLVGSKPPPPLPTGTHPPPSFQHQQQQQQQKLLQQQVRRARLKRSFEEDGSWHVSNFDNLSWIDASFFPPDRPTEVSVDMDFVTSPQALPGTTFLSDLFNSLLIRLPFAPPPFAAADRAICAAILPLNTNLKQNVLHLSAESTDDVNVGAVLSRSRRKASGAHDDDSDGSTETGRGGVHPVPEISGDSMLHVPNAPQPQPPLPPRPINQYSPYPSLSPMVSSTSPRLNPKSADKPPPMEDVWVVLRDYLTNVTLGAQGRARALQSIAEAVVAACAQDNGRIENNANQSGRGMLTEIVRRMRGAERSERDGSVFTLLVNVAAAHGGGVVVERVTHAVFSDVVEEMHGRQDDKVMWERALRCFHILLKTSNYHISEFQHEHYFTTHSNTNISTKCIMALALHVGDIAHADVDHVLVANGLCPRLRSGRSDLSTGIIDIEKAVLLEIGGVDGISSLLVNTASVTTRHLLFGIAFDVAILEAVDAISSDLNYKTGNDIGTMADNVNDNLILKDQVTALRSFFHAYDMADLLVHTFRVGPWSTFVPDLMHILLIQPLTHELLPSPSALSITSDGLEKREEPELPPSEHEQIPQQQIAQQQSTNQQSQQQQQQKGHQQQPNFQKQRGSGSVTNSHASDEDALPKMFQPMAENYVSSVGKLVKHLDKRLCLKTLQSLQYMAQRQSMQLQRREIMHHPREWRLLKAVETQIQYFYTQNAVERDPSTNITSVASNSNSNTGFQSLQQQQLHQQRLQRREANLDAVLEKMCESVEELTSQRASLRALVRMMELLIEFFTIRPPFGSTAKLYAGVHFQSAMHELHAEGGRDSFARLFLRGQVGTPRALLHRAKPNIFTLLLIASRQQASVKRVSENRQCLVEFLGASKDRSSCLKEFTDDDDAALAYRAKEIVCKYSDSSIHARSRSLTTFDEDD